MNKDNILSEIAKQINERPILEKYPSGILMGNSCYSLLQNSTFFTGNSDKLTFFGIKIYRTIDLGNEFILI